MKTGSFWVASGLLVGLASTANATGKVSLTIADSGVLLPCKVEAVDANNKVVSTWPQMYSRAKFDLPPGRYSFVCRIPGFSEGRVGPVDVAEGKESFYQIKVSKIASQQGALQQPAGGVKKKPLIRGKSRWGAARALAPKTGALQKPSGGVEKKPGTPAVPTGPTGKVTGKFAMDGLLIPCRTMEVKAANGAVMPIKWTLTSRYQLTLPAGDYSMTCTPGGTLAPTTVKAAVRAGDSVTVDFTLQKK